MAAVQARCLFNLKRSLRLKTAQDIFVDMKLDSATIQVNSIFPWRNIIILFNPLLPKKILVIEPNLNLTHWTAEMMIIIIISKTIRRSVFITGAGLIINQFSRFRKTMGFYS